MHLYTIHWQQIVELLHQMSVVVGEGLPYSWSVSQDQQLLLVYLTDDPESSEVTTTPVDLAPVIPDEPLPPPEPLTLLTIEPTEMALGDLDTTLIVRGHAFRDSTVIVFNNVVVPTTYASPEELNTIVSPSMAPGAPVAPVAGAVPVQVQQDQLVVPEDASIVFTYTGVAPTPTGVIPGSPGTFTPLGATTPADLVTLQGLGALGETTAWTSSQYVVLGDASMAAWTGSAWAARAWPTGVTAGTPGSFTPAGCLVPQTLTSLQARGALGQTAAWTTGQRVVLGDASNAYWNGTAWTAGSAP